MRSPDAGLFAVYSPCKPGVTVTALQCLIQHFIRTGSSHSRYSSPRSFALVATAIPICCWSRCRRGRQGCQTICVWESAGLGWLCGRLLFQYPGSRDSARWVRVRQKRRMRQSWGLQTTQENDMLAVVTAGGGLAMDSTWAWDADCARQCGGGARGWNGNRRRYELARLGRLLTILPRVLRIHALARRSRT